MEPYKVYLLDRGDFHSPHDVELFFTATDCRINQCPFENRTEYSTAQFLREIIGCQPIGDLCTPNTSNDPSFIGPELLLLFKTPNKTMIRVATAAPTDPLSKNDP